MRSFEVSEQSPRSHCGCGCSLNVPFGVVALLVLSEPSVFLLHFSQPFGDVDDPRLSKIVSNSSEAGKHGSNCIDVVDSPTSIPHPFFAGVKKVFKSSADYFIVLDSGFPHALKDMPYDISTRRVEYFSALIDFGGPEQEFDEWILIIIFILVESRKASIVILVGSYPSVCSIDLILEETLELSSSEVLLHLPIEDEQHSSIIDVGSVLELLSIGYTSILLNLG